LSSRLPTDVTAGVVIETLFGPFSLGGAIGDTGHRKWYFQLGRFF
jgi:NTE family protein